MDINTESAVTAATPAFLRMAKVVDQYKCVTLKDLYSQWVSHDDVAWQQPYVKELFWELKRFIDIVLPSTELAPRSCYDYDTELMGIVDRHLRVARNAGHLQPAFVAVVFDVLDHKRDDDLARCPSCLLTHGYKSQLLSYILARLLQDPVVDHVMALYQDADQRALFTHYLLAAAAQPHEPEETTSLGD